MNLARLFVLAAIPLLLVTACAGDPTKRLPRSLEVDLAPRELEERFLSYPPDSLDEEGKRVWGRFMLLGWREMTRLQQAGMSTQFIREQFSDLEDVTTYLEGILGKEAEKTALAYWLVRELYPNEEILYTVGVSDSGILLYRIDQAGGIPVFSLSEKEFVPVVSIGWTHGRDSFQRLFVIRANEELAGTNPGFKLN